MREMKDSGIEWIGQIPKDWEVCRLKNVCEGFSNGTSVQQTSKGETDFPVTRIETISLGKINFSKVGYVDYFDGIEKYKLASNDILISNINSFAHVGKCAFYNGETKLYHGMNLIKISPLKRMHPYFLLHFLKSDVFISQMQSCCKPAINQVSVSASLIKEIKITNPSHTEQRLIATFLDEKCKDIDTLITLQEEIIAELQAYKQSVISEVVTKGLNPNVTMKDSGVEWIGEIPQHWVVTRFKFIGTANNGLTYAPSDVSIDNTGTLVIRSTNIQNGKLVFDDNVFVTKDCSLIRVRIGDIIICSRNGSASLVGKSAIVTENINATFGAFMMRFRSEYQYNYIHYLLQASINKYKQLFSTTTVNQLTIGTFNSLKVPFIKDMSEQRQIADYLDTKCSQIDQLIALKQQKITELQDYKKSLIYEYVTGKKEVPTNN